MIGPTPLGRLSAADESRLLRRGRATDPEVAADVAAAIDDVRARGDDALRDLARRHDRVRPRALEVPGGRWDAALDTLPAELRSALEQAAGAIRAFHRAQLPPPLELETRPGVRLGRRVEPLRRVGVYAPGGRASYPSSVLMGVIPARVAGVGEVVVCSPPGSDGLPGAAVLAACRIAGADRLFAVGGAGAVAALAFGTATVPRVDRIVGPGNAYVAEAKRQVSAAVGTDGPAGPSELLIVADDAADPRLAAAELVAQAEHDPDASAVLVTTSPALADAVRHELEVLVAAQPRREIIARSLAERGALLTADSLDDAFAFAERYAPEHLLLLVAGPRAALDRVRAAGSVFLGPASSVVFGDYVTGANHVLPTAGFARSVSGLSTLDFVRLVTWQEVTDDAARALAGPAAALAAAEGLPAHAAAALLRASPGALAAPAASGEPVAANGGPDAPPHGRGPALRLGYRDIDLYRPDRRPCDLDLSDNTSLFGAMPAALDALRSLPPDAVTRYPSPYADRLTEAIAAAFDLPRDGVVTGCGADDVLDSAIRALCEPGDVLALPEPTFQTVALFARLNGVRPVPVPLAPNFRLDADALLATRARVMYVCRPNNPTGTAFDRVAVERLARECEGVLLLDEAYADFADDDLLGLATRSDRVVVVRTLSKAYGLAGLRVGFAAGPPALVAEIAKSRGPYKVGGPGEAAAVTALAPENRDWVGRVVREVRANRVRLAADVAALGLATWPSAANFLLIRTPGPATELAKRLRSLGVGVRAFPALPVAGDCIRVTIGPRSAMERFVAALREALERTVGAESSSGRRVAP